ncbi:hypothetical protein OE88DRAFT_1739321 [Heliocybe sulcata]|uniref:Ribonuclease H1 N-terminal domain-containing protein n=1 Tax=Heliocybe sulcata TaxID=5364 RepID=A0A5C3MN59_9AGAM|nr:hypothetical protein OE88DRAFT_1739321 [Heliocybe sulcata]
MQSHTSKLASLVQLLASLSVEDIQRLASAAQNVNQENGTSSCDNAAMGPDAGAAGAAISIVTSGPVVISLLNLPRSHCGNPNQYTPTEPAPAAPPVATQYTPQPAPAATTAAPVAPQTVTEPASTVQQSGTGPPDYMTRYVTLEAQERALDGAKWFVVFIGTRPGLYPGWDRTSQHVIGVPRNVFNSYKPNQIWKAKKAWRESSIERIGGEPEYVAVIRGVEPGVYMTWGDASWHVVGVPGSYYETYRTQIEAQDAFELSEANGEVRILPVKGEEPPEGRGPQVRINWM